MPTAQTCEAGPGRRRAPPSVPRVRLVRTPFRASHLEGLPEALALAQTRALERHPSETLWSQGRAVACYGRILASPGRGLLWLAVSPAAHIHAVGLVRGLLRWLQRTVCAAGLWRLEMVVEPTHPHAVALIQSLGFAFEARLVAYGPQGQDFDQYIWLAKKERVDDR